MKHRRVPEFTFCSRTIECKHVTMTRLLHWTWSVSGSGTVQCWAKASVGGVNLGATPLQLWERLMPMCLFYTPCLTRLVVLTLNEQICMTCRLHCQAEDAYKLYLKIQQLSNMNHCGATLGTKDAGKVCQPGPIPTRNSEHDLLPLQYSNCWEPYLDFIFKSQNAFGKWYITQLPIHQATIESWNLASSLLSTHIENST